MSGSSVAHGSQQWWWISTGVGDSVAPPHLLHLTDPIGEMATSVAYGDWSRRAASRLLRYTYTYVKKKVTQVMSKQER
ncbi:hypothetical protein F2Q68_00015283 [Brassica cretica]|uniref:Uncharacterized protein n=1 Tax=Brassica cretica TaxID=69181 RepID=A0A8S9HJW5_BRACR|nr:hypothetical protein F2Q68_00015283 [Brassica cretica]